MFETDEVRPYLGEDFSGDLYRLNLFDAKGEAAAWFLGVNQRNIKRWQDGRFPVPPGVRMLLRLMIMRKVTDFEAMKEKASSYSAGQLAFDLKKLGLYDASGERAAWFFDVTEGYIQSWLSGEMRVQPGVGMLLALMIGQNVTPEYARSL
jgi:hypothetical protein